MLVAIEVLLGLMIVGGLVALESKRLKNSVTSIAVAGLLFVIASFLLDSAEVGIGGIIAFGVLIPLLFWALKRTTDEDITFTTKGKTARNELFVLISTAAFMITFFIVFISLLGDFPSSPPKPAEGPIGLSIIREIFILLTVLAGMWAITRKIGRRDK